MFRDFVRVCCQLKYGVMKKVWTRCIYVFQIVIEESIAITDTDSNRFQHLHMGHVGEQSVDV